MKKIIIFLFSAVYLFANIGTIVDTTGVSILLRSGKNINVIPKLELQEHDTIKTGKNAKVKIFFQDNTAVSLGQNTTFEIDSYIFTGKKDSQIKFKVLKGFFKTVTGKIGKVAPNRFKLQTKNATIGIRGTVFAADIGDKTDVVMCTDGRIILFTPNGDIEVSSGNSGFAKFSQKPEVKQYSQKQRDELIKNAGWNGSMSLDELVEFIKKNFKEPLRSQLLSTVLNILEKDSGEREVNGKTIVELADDIGFIDDITINGREFESLEQREIEFYPEDLKDGKVIVEGLLESQDKAVDVKYLHVELTTDGGDNWSRADGNEDWQWSFAPKLEKTYEFSIRVVKETESMGEDTGTYVSSQIPYEEHENDLTVPGFVYIGGFRLDLGDGVTLNEEGLSGSGRLGIPYFENFSLSSSIDVDFENLSFDGENVTVGELVYDTPITLQSSIADIVISRLTVGAEGTRVAGDVRFKGSLSFLPTLSMLDSSVLLPNSFSLDIPVSGRTIDIWTEKNVQLILNDGIIRLAYRLGDEVPTVDASSLRAQLNFGELVKNSRRGVAAVADILLDLNEAGESILSFPDTAKAYLLNSDFAIEGINATLDLQNRSVTVKSSINLDDYNDPMFQALSGSLMEAIISQDGFDATLSMDGGLEPVTILERGGVGRDVRLSILGTPSMSLAINGDDLDFGFGELNAAIDFGDILQTTRAQGTVNSVRATIQSNADEASEYALNFMDNAKTYVLGSKLSLEGVSASFNASEKSLHVEARADLSSYDDLVLQSINEALFVADISRAGFSASLTPSDMNPIVILDRGVAKNDIRLEFNASPRVQVSIAGDDIDFDISGGSAKLYFGDLLQGSIATLDSSVDRVYRWSIDGRKKLLNSGKIYLDALEGVLDLRDLNNPIITFNSNVDMSGYGGLLASVNGASLRDATITNEGVSGAFSTDMGNVDIWQEKGVKLVFTDNPTVNFAIDNAGLDIGFANIHADLHFGSLLDDTIARIGNVSPRLGKIGKRGLIRIPTQTAENFNWYIDGAKSLAGSDINLANLSGSLDMSDFSNPSITLNATADLSGYGDIFSHINSAGLEGATISKSGFSGNIIAQLEDIDIWEDKNVKVVFDRNSPISLNLVVNGSGVKVGLDNISANVELGDLLDDATARLSSLGEGVYSWSIDGRHRLISTQVYLENLIGEINLEDLKNPIINLGTRVDLSRYSELFKNLRALELEDGTISRDGFKGSISASIDDIDIWKSKNVKVGFQGDPTMSLEMSRDNFNIGFSNIDASLDFGELLDGEVLRLSQLADEVEDAVGDARGIFANARGSIRRPTRAKPPRGLKVPVVTCRYSWDLQNSHNLIEDEDGVVTVTSIGGTMDLCDLSDPIITFDASADFTNYHFEAGNLGVATVDDATISKRGIDWNDLSFIGASADATILDLGEVEDDVRVEFFNVNAQVASDGDAQVDQADGTLFFGALFDEPYTASLTFNRESNDLKIYTFRVNENIVYSKNDDSIVFSNVNGELEEIRAGVYKVTLNTTAQLQSQLFASLGIQTIEANNLIISEQGFVGDITVRGGLRNSILNGNATVIFTSLSIHVEATRVNKEIVLTTFDASLDLSTMFDGEVIADLDYENQMITWGLDSDARIGKFLFKNLGGELDITRAIDSLNFSGRFGYDGIDELDLELNNFAINRFGVSGTARLANGSKVPIPGISDLNLTMFSTTFGQNISGTAALSYDKESFLGSSSPLHVGLEATIDRTGIKNFSIDSNRLENIAIEGFANMSFTDVVTTPSFSNFSISLDGRVTPDHDLFSSDDFLEFENLKISKTGISVDGAGIYKDVSGADATLGGLSLGIEQVSIGFSGNRFYIGAKGGLSLVIAEAGAGVKLYSDGKIAVDSITLLVSQPGVTFGGQVSWYDEDPIYGNGFSATGLKLKIASIFNVSGEFMIGDKTSKGFYWMAEAQGGLGGTGIPLGPINIYELGGGAAYNMSYNVLGFRPSGSENFILILKSLLGTPDMGFTWHGQIDLNVDSAGQIIMVGDTYMLSTKESSPSDSKISGTITLGMSPASLHINATANLKYMGIGVKGSTDVMFAGREKHVFIGTDPRAQGFNVTTNLGPVNVDIFGIKPWGYFMLDTRRLAFGAGFDFDKRIELDVWGPNPYVRLALDARADALMQYNPFFMDMSAEANANLYVGYGDIFSGHLGAGIALRLRAPNPTFMKVKAYIDIPVYGNASFTTYFPSRPSGGGGGDDFPTLINHVEPYERGSISLMPKLKIVTTFNSDGSQFNVGDMGPSGSIRGGRAEFTETLYFTSMVHNISLIDTSNANVVALNKVFISENEIELIPRSPLRVGHTYRLTGTARLSKHLVTTTAPAGTMAEIMELAADFETYMDEHGSSNGNREAIVKVEDFSEEFTVRDTEKLDFTEIVDFVYPENLQVDVREDESIVIYYDEIVKNLGANNDLISNYNVVVVGADNKGIRGSFHYENSEEPKSVFRPTNPMRIYHYCVNNTTGAVRETFLNDEGQYLNPFNDYRVDGVEEEAANEVGINIPGYIQPRDVNVESVGKFAMSSFDGSYSYFTNADYGLIITDTSNGQIVYFSKFTVKYNDVNNNSIRRFEAMHDSLNPSLEYSRNLARYYEVKLSIDGDLRSIGANDGGYDGGGLGCRVITRWSVEKEELLPEIMEKTNQCRRDSNLVNFATDDVLSIRRLVGAKIIYYNVETHVDLAEKDMTFSEGPAYSTAGADRARERLRETEHMSFANGPRPSEGAMMGGFGANVNPGMAGERVGEGIGQEFNLGVQF